MKNANLKKWVGMAVLASMSLSSGAAYAGNSSGGGGHALDGNLLDLVNESEAFGMKDFKPAETEAFKKVLKPLLVQLHEKAPFFAKDLLDAFQNRKWTFTSLPIEETNDACLSVKANLKQVARQDDKSVLVSQGWFEKEANLQNQAYLLLHEMALNVYRKNGLGNSKCTTDVRNVVRMIAAAGSMNPEAISKQLRDSNFGEYPVFKGTIEEYLVTHPVFRGDKNWMESFKSSYAELIGVCSGESDLSDLEKSSLFAGIQLLFAFRRGPDVSIGRNWFDDFDTAYMGAIMAPTDDLRAKKREKDICRVVKNYSEIPLELKNESQDLSQKGSGPEVTDSRIAKSSLSSALERSQLPKASNSAGSVR